MKSGQSRGRKAPGAGRRNCVNPMGGTMAFIAAVGGASLVCYLLINRAESRSARRDSTGSDGTSSGSSYGASGEGWGISSWFSSSTASSSDCSSASDSSSGDSGGSGGD